MNKHQARIHKQNLLDIKIEQEYKDWLNNGYDDYHALKNLPNHFNTTEQNIRNALNRRGIILDI